MDDDEDDFFAYQTAKSLNNKRTQLKQFFQAPISSKQLSSSSDSNSDSDDELISMKKCKPTSVNIPLRSMIIEPKIIPSKNVVQNEIDAIVTSCFTSVNKEVKRKIKLGKRTAADDQEYDDEDAYVTHLAHHPHGNRQMSRAVINSLNRSQLEEDDEKVTRETAAYNRLDAVLRLTKPLCEKQIDSIDDDDCQIDVSTS